MSHQQIHLGGRGDERGATLITDFFNQALSELPYRGPTRRLIQRIFIYFIIRFLMILFSVSLFV